MFLATTMTYIGFIWTKDIIKSDSIDSLCVSVGWIKVSVFNQDVTLAVDVIYCVIEPQK